MFKHSEHFLFLLFYYLCVCVCAWVRACARVCVCPDLFQFSGGSKIEWMDSAQFIEMDCWEYFNNMHSLNWVSVEHLSTVCTIHWVAQTEFKREGFQEMDSDPILSRVNASTLELFGCKSISLHLSKALVLIAIWIPCCMWGMNKWAELWSDVLLYLLVSRQTRLMFSVTSSS